MSPALESAGGADRLPARSFGTWPASLNLELEKRERGTRLVRNAHIGPLSVQKPFYPEGPDVAHVYLLHPPGGMVSGDDLSIRVQAASGAHALLTAPGAGRVYRARIDGTPQTQTIEISAGRDSIVEWLPQPTLVYSGAKARIQTRFDLDATAALIGWEITVCGLPANGAPFTSGSLLQQLNIQRAGRPLLRDRLSVHPVRDGVFQSPAGLRSLPVSGLFFAGPFDALDDANLDQMRCAITDSVLSPSLAGITRLGSFLVGRYLGECSEVGRNLFIRWWQLSRPWLLGRPASPPRIWAT